MRKTFFAIILVLLLAVFSFGCSFGVKPTDSKVTPASSDASASGDASSTATPSPSASVAPTGTPSFTVMDPVVYNTDAVIFDLSNPMDLSINFTASGVDSIQLSGGAKSTWNFAFENNLLKIPKDVFSSKSAGTYNLLITNASSVVTTCPVYVATKVITTPQEFQSINDNLSGVYVLGKDLDFTGFNNTYFTNLGLTANAEYFQPIGCDGTNNALAGTIGQAFSGKLYGMGHKISNLKVDTEHCSPVYEEQITNVDYPYYDDMASNAIGIFMRTAANAVIDGVCFENCSVKISGIIVGMVVGSNQGTISNVLVKGGTVEGGVLHLDLNCYFAGFAGINGASGNISNCISTVTAITGDPWGGKLTRAFVGKTWGTITNCYASTDGITLDDFEASDMWGEQYVNVSDTGNGFTYTAIDVISTVPTPSGSFEGSSATTHALLCAGTTDASSLYSAYNTSIWTIDGTNLPSLRILSTRP